jgi:glycosyltransferase involved in cell wall biosynthesis
MNFSVIISTFNNRQNLDLVLCGMSRQTRMPDEILVADDGSSDGTDQVVAGWKGKLGCGIEHIWQTDRGIRKTRIMNEAVRRSGGHHLVFLDGDSVPHRKWFSDHADAAGRNLVVCGRRVRIGPVLSGRVNRDFIAQGKLESLHGQVLRSFLSGDTKRFLLGVRLPAWLARCFHPRPRKLMGVNFSLPRESFFAVNGYDEDWPERREDRDLELRLLRARHRFYPLLNRAIVYHLYHAERPSNEQIEARVRTEMLSSRTSCVRGVTPGGLFDPSV